MTNTKFRKRALLSSVAMLLVALIALGSATFAWFAANPDAKASGIQLKTTASSGLVIRSDTDSTWDHDVDLFKGQTAAFNLTPVSQAQNTTADTVVTGHASTFYTVDADKADAAKALATNKVTTATVGDATTAGALYSENVYFRFSDNHGETSNGTAYLKGVSITPVEGASLAGAIRVAVADKDGKIVATFACGSGSFDTNEGQTIAYDAGITATASTSKAYSACSKVNYGNLIGTTLTSGKYTATTSASLGAVVATDKSAVTANSCKVYVYLDGMDTTCFSENVSEIDAAAIISSVELNFSLTA